ncbi:PAS domain-containing protein [bacterium]|nr:PAS domain-containing protein [bacterium]
MCFRPRLIKTLTIKYLFALSAVAALALVNYLILRAEIRAGESSAEVLTISGRQRALMQQSALLAQELVTCGDNQRRTQIRTQLRAAAQDLESAHHRLIAFDESGLTARKTDGNAASSEQESQIRQIYFDTPWLLDTEVRNYLAQLTALADSENAELSLTNPHLQYVRDVAFSERVLDALDEVVATYRDQTEARTARLRRLAWWSFLSTFVVLGLSGLFVFHPMVRRVQSDMAVLNNLNETLEARVEERTALAEQRAWDLQRSEALYHSLVENLPVCIVRKDREGRIVYANALLCELLGRPLNDVIGHLDTDFYPQAMASKYRRDDMRVEQTGQVLEDVDEHSTPGGGRMHVEIRKSPVYDEKGRCIGTQTIFWDVTDRVNAEQQRSEMQDRLVKSERLAAIGQMVAGVAHEARNALQQVQACTQLLRWELAGQSVSRPLDLLQDIEDAHDRLHRLFNDLRGYASPLRLDCRRCDLREIVHQAWRSVRAANGTKPCRLREYSRNGLPDDSVGQCHSAEETAPPRELFCHADPFQLEQVYRNLLENSLLACDSDACIDVLYFSGRDKGGSFIHVAVRDNGPGLTPEVRTRMFEPFFTTRTQGTGLGLPISRRIVEAHGGRIEVVNPPDCSAAQAESHANDRHGLEIAVILPDLTRNALRSLPIQSQRDIQPRLSASLTETDLGNSANEVSHEPVTENSHC